MARFFLLAVIGVGLLYLVSGKKVKEGFKPKPDLAPDDKLRIGVRHKPADCKITAQNGDTVKMRYEGWLRKDGTIFDGNWDSPKPAFSFRLGGGQVIKGWDLGVDGMCIGETRRLTIPAGLGYGDVGVGENIPGKATLVFDVKLEGVEGKGGAPKSEAEEL